MMIASNPIEDARKFRSRCESDPAFWSRHVLGYLPWSKQIEVKKSVRDHRYTMVLSGHAVGKSRVLADIITETLALYPGTRIVATASTNKQVHNILWAEVRGLHENARYPIGGEVHDYGWEIAPGWDATPISVDDPTAMQGFHGAKVLIVVDEGEGVDRRMWGAINSLMSGGDARIVVCLNPVTPSGYLFEESQRTEQWNVINIDCLDHPNVVSGEDIIRGAVTRVWVEEVREKEGEDSAFWMARVKGRYPEKGLDDQITSRNILLDAAGGTAGVLEKKRIGLDVARFGSDRSVLGVFDETRQLIHVEHWQGADLMLTTGRLIAAMDKFAVEPAMTKVDVGGIGAAVVDRAKELGRVVDAVDFGAGPQSGWPSVIEKSIRFLNYRSELAYTVKQLLRRKLLSIPEKYRDVWADLMAPKLVPKESDGVIELESKKDLRKRIGRSPDFGDMVLIAMSNGAQRRPKILVGSLR